MSAAAKSHATVRNSCKSETSLTHPRNGASLYALMPTNRARFAMAQYNPLQLTVSSIERLPTQSAASHIRARGIVATAGGTLGRDCVSSEARHRRLEPPAGRL